MWVVHVNCKACSDCANCVHIDVVRLTFFELILRNFLAGYRTVNTLCQSLHYFSNTNISAALGIFQRLDKVERQRENEIIIATRPIYPNTKTTSA